MAAGGWAEPSAYQGGHYASRIVLPGFCSCAHQQGHAETTVPAHELQGKIDYCENCHGVAAQGFHGYYPIPRLAGQQPEYVKNQFEAFVGASPHEQHHVQCCACA